MEYSSKCDDVTSAQEVQISLSLSQIHTSTVSPHYCLFVFIASQPLWDVHTMLGENGRKCFISSPLHTHRHKHTQTHAKRNQSSRGVIVDISVNTSNCLPAWELVSVNPAWQSLLFSAWLRARRFIGTRALASVRTTSVACASFVSQLIGLQRATHSKKWSEFIIFGNRETRSPKTAAIETNSPSSVRDKEYSEPF